MRISCKEMMTARCPLQMETLITQPACDLLDETSCTSLPNRTCTRQMWGLTRRVGVLTFSKKAWNGIKKAGKWVGEKLFGKKKKKKDVPKAETQAQIKAQKPVTPQEVEGKHQPNLLS